MSILLDYGRPDSRLRRWGPILIVPSWWTWVVLGLLVASAAWVWRDHEPWVKVATIPAATMRHESVNLPAFSPDGQLISLSNSEEIEVFDRTGLRVSTLLKLQSSSFSIFPLYGGRELLVLEAGRPSGVVIDVRAGKIVRETMNLPADHARIINVSADGTQIITEDSKHRDEPKLLLWELKRGPTTTVVPGASAAGELTLPVSEVDEYRGYWRFVEGPYQILVGRGTIVDDWMAGTTVEVYELISGRRLASFPLQFPFGTCWAKATVSDDATRLCVTTGSGWGSQVVIWDMPTLRRVGAPRTVEDAMGFARSSHLFAAEARCEGMCLFDDPGGRPVAVVPYPAGDWWFKFDPPAVSADGRLAAVFTETGLTLVRSDARESRFGMVGMGRVWVLGLVSAVLFISMAVGAHRQRRYNRLLLPMPLLVALTIVAFAASLELLLSGLGNRFHLQAAPFALLCLIGVFANSRFWAALAVVAMGVWIGQAALPCWRMMDGYMRNPVLMTLVDREYSVPRIGAMAVMGCVGAVMLCGLAWMSWRVLWSRGR